jgi:hypothetical protein
MYVQGIAKDSYLFHLATEEKAACSKCDMKEKYFVLSWHITI